MKRWIRSLICAVILLTLSACSTSMNQTETPSVTISNTADEKTASEVVTLPAEMQTGVPTTGQTITVYFTNESRFNIGTLPYEDPVTRPLPAGVSPARAVLDALFEGPTEAEYAQGLRLFSSGFTGVREMTIKDGIAHVYLEGKCSNNGAAYSVGSVIINNLSQFPEIKAVKIYDENGSNDDPDSNMSSLPYCLEP